MVTATSTARRYAPAPGERAGWRGKARPTEPFPLEVSQRFSLVSEKSYTCSARAASALLAVGKFEIVNASSVPHGADNLKLPVFRPGRSNARAKFSSVNLENSPVRRVARVGYRMTSPPELSVVAITLLLWKSGCRCPGRLQLRSEERRVGKECR